MESKTERFKTNAIDIFLHINLLCQESIIFIED